jgi:predicted ATP-binding protein involved in virulence
MRLITRYERITTSGYSGERIRSELFLHGSGIWPSDATPDAVWASRGKLVDARESENAIPQYTLRASLRVLAHDNQDEEQLARSVKDLRGRLLQSPGEWIPIDGAWLRFERDDVVVGEQETLLDGLIKSTQWRLQIRRKRILLRVEEIILKNFRAFTDMQLSLSSAQSTVLIGTNGSGKSTMLDAASLLLQLLIGVICQRPPQGVELRDDDITNGCDVAKVSIKAGIGATDLAWDVGRALGRARAVERSRLFLDEAVAGMRDDLDKCRPVIVHYGVNRALLVVELKKEEATQLRHLEGVYDGALDWDLRNFDRFFEWFRAREYLEKEVRIDHPDHRDHQLDAVRRAIDELMPGFDGLRVQPTPVRMVVSKDKQQLYVDQLSDGEKCLLAMAGDLARRLAVANSYADDPLLGGGVVLIDEIELHLHPQWQRRVLLALERTFPNCQFIVSTHSPQVLSSLRAANVRVIEGFELRTLERGTWRRDTNRILDAAFGDPGRPPEVAAKLNELRDAVDADRFDDARRLIAELRAMVEGDDPDVFFYQQLLPPEETPGAAS